VVVWWCGVCVWHGSMKGAARQAATAMLASVVYQRTPEAGRQRVRGGAQENKRRAQRRGHAAAVVAQQQACQPEVPYSSFCVLWLSLP